jgi:hypothetical protein
VLLAAVLVGLGMLLVLAGGVPWPVMVGGAAALIAGRGALAAGRAIAVRRRRAADWAAFEQDFWAHVERRRRRPHWKA